MTTSVIPPTHGPNGRSLADYVLKLTNAPEMVRARYRT